MKTIIICKCGKKIVISSCIENSYQCPYCDLVYVKEYYIENGEYKYTFKLVKEEENAR